MDPQAFAILDRKRLGHSLTSSEIQAVVDGAADGSWGDAELGAFLTSAAIRGLDAEETRALTVGMLESGEQWDLASEIANLGDKHSTGGVGDKVSLILSPLLAACGRPVVMLTGRGLGHTGGTADKLEAVPGLDLALDKARCLRSIERCGFAIGMATGEIAPADRRLYALRDRTATIASLQLITASILSKKLATGAGALVFDIKTGAGAFLPELDQGRQLGRLLVDTAEKMGRRCRALITDMSQPLGWWSGHTAEVRETFAGLEGRGAADLMEVTYALSEELSELTGERLERAELEQAISSGRAREFFVRWAEEQGADSTWLAQPSFELAPHEVVIAATASGTLREVANRRLGELLTAAGGGRLEPGGPIDFGISLRVEKKLGEQVEQGEPLARLYLRRRDAAIESGFGACFEVGQSVPAPSWIVERISA